MARYSSAHIAFIYLLFQCAAAVPAFAEVAHSEPDTALHGSLSSPRAAITASSPYTDEGDPGPAPDTARPASGNPFTWGRFPQAQAKPFSLAEIETGYFGDRGDDSPEAAVIAGTGDDWPWRRAATAEYVVLTGAVAGTVYFEHENGKPAKADWTSRNGFDEAIRDALRLESRSARDATHLLGDVLMGVMISAPILDSFATLGLRDGRWDALWQTEMINIESFAFTSLVSSLMQNLIARERPFVRNCANGVCEGDLENRSMPSGHVAYALTGAGLVCNHHEYQSLYGDPASDRAACVAGIGIAALDGLIRIMADRHYATDVAAGVLIGYFSGFVLPRLLHYSWPQKRPDSEARSSGNRLLKHVMVRPLALDGGAGLTCAFRF